jgi:hypothetical protein
MSKQTKGKKLMKKKKKLLFFDHYHQPNFSLASHQAVAQRYFEQSKQWMDQWW